MKKTVTDEERAIAFLERWSTGSTEMCEDLERQFAEVRPDETTLSEAARRFIAHHDAGLLDHGDWAALRSALDPRHGQVANSPFGWAFKTPKVERCAKHGTWPEDDEPCWSCENEVELGKSFLGGPLTNEARLADCSKPDGEECTEASSAGALAPRSDEAVMSMCAQCGASPAPYIESRCMLHYGGQTEMAPVPIPMVLHCPECKTRHIDEGDFATKVHHTHSCQGCGLTWRPAVVATVGVQFLPGFKNGPRPGQPVTVTEAEAIRRATLAAHNPEAAVVDAREWQRSTKPATDLVDAVLEMLAQVELPEDEGGCSVCKGINGERHGHEANCAVLATGDRTDYPTPDVVQACADLLREHARAEGWSTDYRVATTDSARLLEMKRGEILRRAQRSETASPRVDENGQGRE